MRIAVVQLKIAHLNSAKNLARIEMFIEQAKKKQADVIVFPEDCITGSIFGNKNYLDSGEVKKSFQKLAQKYVVDIVTGSCMTKTALGVFNASYYIDARGTVIHEYYKNHLYDTEHAFLNPGTDVAVFDTRFGKAGIIICWDILFPDQFARMKELGVQIVYCPSYWYKEIAGEKLKINKNSEEELVDALCIARAREYKITFVYVNAAGIMRYDNGTRDTLIGHSQIALPYTGAMRKLNHSREAVFIEDI